MDIYYQIWVDSLLRMKAQEKNQPNDWKIWSMIMISVAMTLNFMLFMSILQSYILGISFYVIVIPSQTETINSILTISILFVLPVVVVNYLLIFRNKRYEKLIEKYPYRNGKLAIPYIFISFLLPVVLVFGYIIIVQGASFSDFFPSFDGNFSIRPSKR